MSENAKPRLAEVLGVEVGQEFDVEGASLGPFRVTENGCLCDDVGGIRPILAVQIINHPELIKRRWMKQEVEDARNIIRLLGVNSYRCVTRDTSGEAYLLKHLAHFDIMLPRDIFPSLKSGETVKLADIIGGNE